MQFSQKNIEPFFCWPFWFFFQSIFPMKSTMGFIWSIIFWKSWWRRCFQPKTTFLYYFAHHWTTGIVYNLYIVQVTKYFLLHRVKNGISLIYKMSMTQGISTQHSRLPNKRPFWLNVQQGKKIKIDQQTFRRILVTQYILPNALFGP